MVRSNLEWTSPSILLANLNSYKELIALIFRNFRKRNLNQEICYQIKNWNTYLHSCKNGRQSSNKWRRKRTPNWSRTRKIMKQLQKEELKSGRRKSKSRKWFMLASFILLYFQVVHCFNFSNCFRKLLLISNWLCHQFG